MSCSKLTCRYYACSHTKRTDWVTLIWSFREAPHKKFCQCKKWHILTELKYLLLFNVVFIPSSLLIRGMLLTLLYESGQWDAGRLNDDTKVTHFGRGWSQTQTLWAVGWQRLWALWEMAALVSLQGGKVFRVLSALFPSQISSLIPACTFLTLLWPLRFPRIDHYAITFEVTFEYNPVQDLVLQTCLQKWLVAFPYSIHKLCPKILQSSC